MDEDEAVNFVSTELAGRLLNSKWFRRGILTVIITNSLLIAVETNDKIVSLFHCNLAAICNLLQLWSMACIAWVIVDKRIFLSSH